MQIITNFRLENESNFKRINEPVRVACPFPSGLISDLSELQIRQSGSEKIYPSDKVITGRWTDGSIKWLCFDILSSIEPHETYDMEIVRTSDPDDVSVDTEEKHESSRYLTDKNETAKNQVGLINILGSSRKVTIVCKDKQNLPIDFVPIGTEVSLDTCFKRVTLLKFKAIVADNDFVFFNIRVVDFKTTGLLKFEFVIQNRASSHHPGGYWDLGDRGSFYFTELAIVIQTFSNEKCNFSIDSSLSINPENSGKKFSLLQQSSGGKNWNSVNHIAFEGKNFRFIKGAQILVDGKTSELDRISPAVYIQKDGADEYSGLALEDFWQNFPSSISYDQNEIKIGLFPDSGEIFELQGGEQKKQILWIKTGKNLFDVSMEWVQAPMIPIFPSSWYEQCSVYPYMTTPDDQDPAEYFDLLSHCISEKNNFFDRREIIDEFGWRNYGELYADHESSYLPENQYYISHYNNQYDFMYYALVHFWRSSDKRWYKLSDQLAKHVRDIDIYHTENDRETFNGGIFWHTNHYVSAYTATHRCYSAKANPPVSGGLSIQNCYVNGLINNYYVTGDSDTYDSVVEVLEYAYRLVNGPRNLTKKIKYFAKEFVKTVFYYLKAKINKSVFPFGLFQGPGRESGNALLILVKAFEFTGNKKYLVTAGKICRKCISPSDNLTKMKMDQPEYRWMYLLFLQSVIEFIRVKEQLGKRDKDYIHAMKSFNRYVEWMVKHEYSYLDKPDRLEFPNETWAMQELRKPHILYEAAFMTNDESFKKKLIAKADLLYEKAFSHLKSFGSRQYLTRPLVLAAAYGLLPIYFKRKLQKISDEFKSQS